MRIQKTEIRNIDGIPQQVTIEIDTKEDEIINRHLKTLAIEKRIGFNTSGKSTIGKAKKAGAMGKANDAKNFKGNKTRTATRTDNQKRVNDSGVENMYKIHLPQF